MRTRIFPRPSDGPPSGTRRMQTPQRYGPSIIGERGESETSGWPIAIRFFVTDCWRVA